MKKMLFIMNPFAGQRRANRYLADILTMFSREGYDISVHMTSGPGDGARVVQERAAGMDLIVCCGGDGTFNETVSGLIRAGVDVPVGYIPAGTTNDFAASMKIPTNVNKAARAILEGTPHRYDVGAFGERFFTYVASFGAFTRSSYATPQSVKNALGHTAYVLEGMQELSQIKNIHVRLELDDDRVIEDDFLFGAISNSLSVGGILTLDPKQVDMSDGKFELLLVRAPQDITEVSECLRALQTQKYNCRMITFVSASRVRVTAAEELVWTLDGEREDIRDTVEAKVLRHAIRLIQRD
jgi:YegS/Rv2252/BmrU family lipid kinase